MTRQRRDESGFTLAEMLVVLVIMGLVGLAVSYSGAFARQPSPEAVAKTVANELKAAALDAVLSGRNSALTVSVEDKTVSGEGRETFHLPAIYDVRLTTARQLADAGKAGRIMFFPDGTSTGGRIAITAADGRGKAVSVHWLTGAVTLEPVE